jgi:predicted Zn-ribbon and HTH transcriptional regulator
MARIKVDGYQCERCGHIWVKRMEDEPALCPKCKTPYWNKPRKEEKKES